MLNLYLIGTSGNWQYVCAHDEQQATLIGKLVFNKRVSKKYSVNAIYYLYDSRGIAHNVHDIIMGFDTGYFDTSEVSEYEICSFYKFIPFNVRKYYIDKLLQDM